MVDDEEPPFAFVSIEGDVSLSDDLDTMRYWATRIAARYMGEDQADAYGTRNAVPESFSYGCAQRRSWPSKASRTR